MKLPLKIVLINLGLALVFGLLMNTQNSHKAEGFGIVFLMYGVIALIAGLFALAATDKRLAQGLLLSGGLLLLIGVVTCGASFS